MLENKEKYLSLPLHIYLFQFCLYLSQEKSNNTTIFNYANKTIAYILYVPLHWCENLRHDRILRN